LNIVELDDGEKAIRYLRRTEDYADLVGLPDPRLVLLDLKMPFRNGLEVLQAVRAEGSCRHTPIVLLTSSVHDRDIVEAYQAGANAFVVKPGVYEDFISTLRRTADFWLDINRLPASLLR
jgi:CheY-like chemotaxis protein